jgi:hypothetical protein
VLPGVCALALKYKKPAKTIVIDSLSVLMVMFNFGVRNKYSNSISWRVFDRKTNGFTLVYNRAQSIAANYITAVLIND